jgi:hypothetical protein
MTVSSDLLRERLTEMRELRIKYRTQHMLDRTEAERFEELFDYCFGEAWQACASEALLGDDKGEEEPDKWL